MSNSVRGSRQASTPLSLSGGLIVACAASALLTLPARAQDASGATRRLALFVGNDSGGDGTRPLLYAKDDARRLYEVMTRLGGVRREDALLVLDGDSHDVDRALSELDRRARESHAQNERAALFFFYSGHAKDGALRLGSSAVPLEALKVRLAQSPADIRVAVFDACRSGSLTRTKGVRHAPAFEVETDASRQVKGLVILTSSAADEDSQESDAIGASYFSYYLATGLLGGADQGGDGRVSLSEAYAFAYERTVASTADSAAGAQHPTYSFDLAGNGDLVLTDTASRREGVRLPASATAGTWYLVDGRGVVVAEVVKGGAERMVAVPPGAYTVKLRLPDRLKLARLDVREGQVTELDEARLRDAHFSDDPVKGTGLTALYAKHWSLSATGGLQAVFDAPTTAGGYFPSSPYVGLEGTLHNFFGRGFGLGLDGALGSTQGVLNTALLKELAYRYGVAAVGVSIVHEWGQDDALVPFLGARLALQLMTREFTDAALPKQSYGTTSPGLVAGLKWRVTRSVSLMGRARVHYLLYTIDEQKSLGWADLGLVLDYELRD